MQVDPEKEKQRAVYFSASANRKQAVARLSNTNLIQPIGHQARMFKDVITPNKFRMSSKLINMPAGVAQSKFQVKTSKDI